jgi:hypothetical protein
MHLGLGGRKETCVVPRPLLRFRVDERASPDSASLLVDLSIVEGASLRERAAAGGQPTESAGSPARLEYPALA